MNHIEVSIPCKEEQKGILIALLSDIGFEGFEEKETSLLAYILEENYEETALTQLLQPMQLQANTTSVAAKNWNEEWERNFQPVVVDGFCTVRADFHEPNPSTPYEIIIMPKMTFGTGHHATTQLMMEAMQSLAIKNKTVLDFGTGTGILAILAAMLGAKTITGIENEQWSCENAVFNASRNNIENFNVHFGSLEQVEGQQYDIILANINRHILLQYMQGMATLLTPGGQLLMSGILIEDETIVSEAAVQVGLTLHKVATKNNWMLIHCVKG